MSKTSVVILNNVDDNSIMMITPDGFIISRTNPNFYGPVTVSGTSPNGSVLNLTDKLNIGYDFVPSSFGITDCSVTQYGITTPVPDGEMISSVL